jgi:hypothetical protein
VQNLAVYGRAGWVQRVVIRQQLVP